MPRTLTAAALVAACVLALIAPAAATSRIKDLANFEGVRQNQLIGYGLVVGLNGTGDTLNNIPFTKQSIQAMLERMGVNIRGAQIRTGNVAAVMVTANLPPFGTQGTRGMMKAAEIARLRRIPYFGICYGFQWATVEYARNVAGLTDADSTECNPEASTKVIYKLRDLLGIDDLGGTMRLGSYACELAPGSLAQKTYGADLIHERHRHRYEFNCLYERTLHDHGLRISGRSPDGKFVEIAELPGHPWYLAVQFHPEFKSKPTHPHPLFAAFVGAAYRHKTAAQRDASSIARGIALRA